MITADHVRFYREGKQCYPTILSERMGVDQCADAACVVLPCKPDSDLKWHEALERADACVASGKLILWHFDFGLETLSLQMHDEATFRSYIVAIEAFVADVLPKFQEQTFGMCVYRGEVGMARFDPLDVQQWAAECGVKAPSPLHEQLFRCDILSHLLHRLLSFFPDSMLACACIDLEKCINPALQALMISRLRNDYLHLFIKGARAPLSPFIWDESGLLRCPATPEPQVAVCIPENFNCHDLLNPLLAYLQTNEAQFRLIAEQRLTEEWDGIETLIAIPEHMNALGKRKLTGFEAAGGKVVKWAKKS